MRALVLEDVEAIAVRDVPEPSLVEPTDAIVRVELAGLCGSDLHPYLGRERVRMGVVAGHEAIGTVLEVGGEVDGVTPGDRVIVPFSIACGGCGPCRRGLSARCTRGELFGYGDPDDPGRPALGGAQAERIRVPLAATSLVRIPSGVDDHTALLCTDTLCAAWLAVQRSGVEPGEPVAVVGLGTVGLLATSVALQAGIGPVVAVDPVEDRRGRAAALGAEACSPEEAPAVVASIDAGGLPAVVEAAGSDAAQALAFALCAPGATLSVIAFSTHARFGFRPIDAYDANLTLRTGRASVRSVLPELLARVTDGRLRVPVDTVLTHPALRLEDGPDAYRAFAAREPGFVKAAFRP